MEIDESQSTSAHRAAALERRWHRVARVSDAAPVPADRATTQGVKRAELAALVALVAFGGIIRAHGFTSKDLWFDDAWVALSAKVGVGTAVHMGLAAPGYLFALRAWIGVDPNTTAWLQVPAFVLAVLAIPLTWALLRWMRMPRWIALGGALLVTVMPILVLYSTRVKEYPFDFVAAAVLLALYETVRRDPTPRHLGVLGIASALAVVGSGSCVVVVVVLWVLVVLQVGREARLRRPAVIWAAVAAASCVGVWAVFLRALPRSLYTYWKVRGYLFDFHSLATIEKSVSLSFGGFVHEAFGLPAPPSFFRYGGGIHSGWLTLTGVVVLCAIVVVPVVIAIRARAVTPALASAFVLVLAAVLGVLGLVPFGDGRTDEVLYPSLVVCLASIAQAAASILRPRALAVGRVGLSVVAAGSLAFGAIHPADYPTIDLRGVAAQLRPELRPGDEVFVSTFDTFGWCYYRLSPCTVAIGGSGEWIQGFRPVSTDRSVFFATSFQTVLPEILPAMRRAERIWYVGFTYGTYDVASSSAAQDQPVMTQMLRVLLRHGWTLLTSRPGTPVTRVASTHAYAWLLVRSPHR